MEKTPTGARIRLDDQIDGNEEHRQYKDSLLGDELHDYLRRHRFQAGNLPVAHRRLISVCNLDATTINTLAETALWNQRDCLRDAFWKHISFETSIRVGQAIGGFSTPHIEMHLPYLALRTILRSADATVENEDLPEEKWEDATFLHQSDTTSRDLIYRAHISIVIWIWDPYRWTGYMLSNPCPINTDAAPIDDEDDHGTESEDDEEEDCEPPREDIFVPESVEDFMSDQPIWDPRKYFLQIAAVWAGFLLKEYTHLIRTLEERVNANVSLTSIFIVQCLEVANYCRVKESIECDIYRITKTMQLLRKVHTYTSTAIKAWKEFSAYGGNLRYLVHSQDHKTEVAISKIKASFLNLAILEQKLVALDKTCEESAKTVRSKIACLPSTGSLI